MACLWVEHDQAEKVQQMLDHGLTLKMINVIDIQKSVSLAVCDFVCVHNAQLYFHCAQYLVLRSASVFTCSALALFSLVKVLF